MVSWPNTGSYTLQQNNNLAVPAGWATSGYTITTANGTNSITITPPREICSSAWPIPETPGATYPTPETVVMLHANPAFGAVGR